MRACARALPGRDTDVGVRVMLASVAGHAGANHAGGHAGPTHASPRRSRTGNKAVFHLKYRFKEKIPPQYLPRILFRCWQRFLPHADGTEGVAKHTRSRGFRAPNIDLGIALGTLASKDLISAQGDASDTDIWLMSTDMVVGMEGHTVGEGPLIVGVAHSDYTDAEIEQWVENAVSWTRADQLSQEIQRRKIRTVGQFSGEGVSETLNDGKPIRTRCGWAIQDGQGLTVWVYSESGAALTTGSIVNFNGKAYTRKD